MSIFPGLPKMSNCTTAPPNHSLVADLTFHPELASLSCNTRICKPPEKYGFSDPLSPTKTLASIHIPS